MAPKDREEALTLELLEVIEANSDVTQRHLANRLGVALGLANSYLKRCAKKGLIKITQAPANRYLYYLTPQGFAEKSRLTAEYLSSSFTFYGRASDSISSVFRLCDQRGYQHVLLGGVSEFAEIASVRAHDFSVEINGTFDRQSLLNRFIGRSVWRDWPSGEDIDACVITALVDSQRMYADVRAHMSTERVIVPTMLASIIATAPVVGGDV